jgi:hypothetical protein
MDILSLHRNPSQLSFPRTDISLELINHLFCAIYDEPLGARTNPHNQNDYPSLAHRLSTKGPKDPRPSRALFSIVRALGGSVVSPMMIACCWLSRLQLCQLRQTGISAFTQWHFPCHHPSSAYRGSCCTESRCPNVAASYAPAPRCPSAVSCTSSPNLARPFHASLDQPPSGGV